jgi:hypothetical protein
MRSESEIRFVRAKPAVGQRRKVSAWHAIVPGLGATAPSPGVACGTGLSGSLQFDSYQGVLTLDGTIHDECMAAAQAYIASVDPSPGPLPPQEPEQTYARPAYNSYTKSSRQELEAGEE